MRIVPDKRQIDDIQDIVDRVLDEIRAVPFAYATLIQLSPTTFPGFMGFADNTQGPVTNPATGGTTTSTGTGATITDTPEEGPVPNGTNFDRYTIVTAPFRNPANNITAGANYPVNWYVMSGSTYYATTRSTVTATNGTATIVIAPGTIDIGASYTIVAECTFSAVPLAIDTQQISFLPAN